MTEVSPTSKLRHLLYPKCPYNNSIVILVSRVGVIALGTVGLRFLHIWVAIVYLVYSVIYNFLIWPIIHCQYCYYKVKKNVKDKVNGKIIQNHLTIVEWKKTYLANHIKCGKRWGSPNLMILSLGPIILIILSLFVSFSIIALLSLIGFIALLVLFGIYMRRKICPTCAFMKECHAAF